MNHSPPSPAPSAAPRIAFQPVQMARVRHDGWCAARQELFLIQLERLGLVSAAAQSVGMSPKSAYALLKRSQATQQEDDSAIPTFARAWEAAIEMGREEAHSLAIDRAVNGEIRPIFYRGRQVGERRVYNDRLLIAALRLKREYQTTPGRSNE